MTRPSLDIFQKHFNARTPQHIFELRMLRAEPDRGQGDRMFLHCRRLRFLDFEALPFEATAELPRELRDVLQKLRASTP